MQKGSIAQLVEQRIENPRVGGSSPSRATHLTDGDVKQQRGVAQPGRAPVLGTGCRRFESCRPDYSEVKNPIEAPLLSQMRCGVFYVANPECLFENTK